MQREKVGNLLTLKLKEKSGTHKCCKYTEHYYSIVQIQLVSLLDRILYIELQHMQRMLSLEAQNKHPAFEIF